MIWRFLDTGERSGAYNMALDERLATDLRDGHGGPTIRVFGWQPWAVSLGFNQSEAEIDQEKCKRDAIDIVRRPTGGRAILHARELTYSVVMFSSGKSILDVYNDIGRALVKGLRLFGVDVDLAKSRATSPVPSLWRQIPCFASTGRYEITVDGKKLVGSAQRRYRGGQQGEVVLQHGSILVGPEHRRLPDYIALGWSTASRRVGTQRDVRGDVVPAVLGLNDRTTELESVVGRKVEVQILRDCIKKGFEEEWEISLAEDNTDRARRLEAYLESYPAPE